MSKKTLPEKKNPLSKIFRFLSHGIWQIDIEARFRGFTRFLFLQYQMLVLEIRLFFLNHSVSWAA